MARAERTEVATPTNKMRFADLVDRGRLELDESVARSFYKCTSCLNSRSGCRHDVAVDGPLREARRQAVSSGVVLPEVAALRDKFQRCGSPYSADLGAVLRATANELELDRVERAEGATLVPSCATLARDPGELRAALTVFAALQGGELCAKAAGCCGYPLFEAGLDEAFRERARAFAASLADREEVVMTGPACVWTLKHAYPRVGVEAPKVRPFTVWLSERLPELEARLDRADRAEETGGTGSAGEGAAPVEPVPLYHDACFLGRRLGVYDAPRRLIGALWDEPCEELEDRRENSLCAGAGAGYRWTHPEGSREIARMALDAMPERETEDGLRPLVSECPSARRQFRREGAARVRSLVELIAERLTGRPGLRRRESDRHDAGEG